MTAPQARWLFLPLLVAACTPGGPLSGGDDSAPPSCAPGFHADGTTCVPEACGLGTWGDLPVDEATVYISPDAADGGDGSVEAPLRSIQAGLDLAGGRGGGLVAVAAGSYPETLELTSDHGGVHLAGRCRELVTLDASVGDESTAGIDIDALYGEVVVSSVSVVGASYMGVRVGSGEVRLESSRVERSALVGIGAYRESLTAPVILVVEDCEVSENNALGVLAQDSGTEVVLVDTVIEDSQPSASGDFGYGIQVDEGAILSAVGCMVAGSAALGVKVSDAGTLVSLADTIVRDTVTYANGEGGTGIQVSDGAALLVEACDVVGNTGIGILALDHGTHASIADTMVRDTRRNGDGDGYGIDVYGGAVLEARDCEVTGNSGAGILAYDPGTRVSLHATEVRDTAPTANGDFGHGIGVQDGAALVATHCVIARNHNLGMLVGLPGSSAVVVDTTVSDTRPGSDGEGGLGIQTSHGASLMLERSEVAGNSGVGIVSHGEGTTAVLVETVVRDTRGDSLEDGFGIQVSDGAALSAVDCEVAGNLSPDLLTWAGCQVSPTPPSTS